MPDAAVAIDRLEPLQVALEFPAKVAFDRDIERADRVDDGVDLLGSEILRTDVGVDIGDFENALRIARADAVDIRKRGFDAFVTGDFYSKEAGHRILSFEVSGMVVGNSTLLLLVTRVLADYAHHIFAADDFAVFTNAFDGCSDFHVTRDGFSVSFFLRNVMRPLLRS